MNDFGFMKIAAAVPKVKVADVDYNLEQIKEVIEAAAQNGANILVTPELSLSGYTCGDLFFQDKLLQACEDALAAVKDFTAGYDFPVAVGLPIKSGTALYNAAVLVRRGKILGAVPKRYPANYNEFYEKRWFARGGSRGFKTISVCGEQVPFGNVLFKLNSDCTAGIELCEDLWVAIPPSSYMAVEGANLILNLSASNEYVTKNDYRRDLIKGQSARCICAYAYSGAGTGESTTDLVFGGSSFIAENGAILAESRRFSDDSEIIYADIDLKKLNSLRAGNTCFADCGAETDAQYETIDCGDVPNLDLKYFTRRYPKTPFVPDGGDQKKERANEILSIQTAGLVKRLTASGSGKCVVGVSGGLDSALALLVAENAVRRLNKPPENVTAVTMPGFGTTDRTYGNAVKLIHSIGAELREIPISSACSEHLKSIGHNLAVRDSTYENAQARERTQILMDIANMVGGILVGTGDLSEAALGWSTYNGDHMSMYGVNAGVPKTLVRYLIDAIAVQYGGETQAVLTDILNTPVSPELLPPDESGKISQKTEESIGPYILHDFFLYHFIRYGAEPKKILFLAEREFSGIYSGEEIKNCLKVFLNRFFHNQFKRSCTPDAPKVGTVSLSPRGDWRMPSDAEVNLWTEDLR